MELRNVAGRAHNSHLNNIHPKLGTSRRTMNLTILPSMVATNMDINVRHIRAMVCMDSKPTSGVQSPGTMSRRSFLSWTRNSRLMPGPAALVLLPVADLFPPPPPPITATAVIAVDPFVLLLSLDSPDGRRDPPSGPFSSLPPSAPPPPPHTFNTMG